jgi:hypothetical protein
MALHPCPSCSTSVSDTALACPECGLAFPDAEAVGAAEPCLHFQRKLVLAACAIGAVGTILEGWIALVLFALAAAFAFVGARSAPLSARLRMGVAIPSAVAAIVALVEMVGLREKLVEVDGSPLTQVLVGATTQGTGLFVVLLAGAAAAVLAFAFPHPADT